MDADDIDWTRDLRVLLGYESIGALVKRTVFLKPAARALADRQLAVWEDLQNLRKTGGDASALLREWARICTIEGRRFPPSLWAEHLKIPWNPPENPEKPKSKKLRKPSDPTLPEREGGWDHTRVNPRRKFR